MKHLFLIPVLLLGACETMPKTAGYNQVGTVIGAGSGSYIGKKFGNGGAVAGGLMGAYTGYNILRLFGEKRDYAMEAFQKAAEYRTAGETVNWRDKFKFEYGSYTPIRTTKSPTGVYCRELLETVMINSRLFSNKVQACRNPKGRWIVEK